MEPNCVSYNLKTTSETGKHKCELNNASHEGHEEYVQKNSDYVYRGAKVKASQLTKFKKSVSMVAPSGLLDFRSQITGCQSTIAEKHIIIFFFFLATNHIFDLVFIGRFFLLLQKKLFFSGGGDLCFLYCGFNRTFDALYL